MLYFAGSLIIFSLFIGFVFAALFSRHNKAIHIKELENRAAQIAQSLAGFWTGNPKQGHGAGQGMGQGMGYGAYLRFLDDIAMTDVWIVDNNLQQITRGHGQASLTYKDLPSGAEVVIMAAMDGETIVSESFGAFLGTPSITVAMPITLTNAEVAGVVLLHEQIESIRGTTESVIVILLLSMGAAVVMSFFVVRAIAGHFTMPLRKMKAAAVKISGGDYAVKTNVVQDDEIGELASSLDDMAAKLNDASKESAKLEKLRRDFVANISHELRTPVTVIRGSLEALCDGVVTNPQMVADYHRQMFSESIYLERLVSDLLDLARLQNTDFSIEMGQVDLQEIAQDAVRGIRRVASEKRVEVRLSDSCKNPIVLGDYGRLRQMLFILLDNAVKFSPEKGIVGVFLSRSQNKVMLSVKDEGPGILPEDLPHIFDRFYKQRSEANKTGVGLGLAIAKQIADRHGALIEVQNRQITGCEFKLTLKGTETKEIN